MTRSQAHAGLTIPAILAAMVTASSCRAEVDESAGEPRPVKTALVREILIPDEVSGFGSLSFRMKVDVSSPQDAMIVELPFREGDKVEAGDVVARLRNPQLELALGKAENGVAQSEAALALTDAELFEGRVTAESRLLGLERDSLEIELAKRELAESERKQADQETLFKAGGVAEESVRSGRFAVASARDRLTLLEKDLEISLLGFRDEDLLARRMPVPGDPAVRRRALVALATETLSAERAAAVASLGAARSELESARVAMRELTVLAPVAGVIGARYFEVGERVKRDDALLTVMDVESLYAAAAIREAEALRLSPGMRATVFVDAADASFEGVVDMISPVADARSASFAARVIVRDPGARLKPGMFARVTIVAGAPRRALVVPETSIVDRSDDSGRIFVVADGSVFGRTVTAGDAADSGRIVLSGLSEGEVVVDKPEPGLEEGERVSVSN